MGNLLQLSDRTTINLDRITSVLFLDNGQAMVYLDFAYMHKGHDEQDQAFIYLEGEEAANLKMHIRRYVPRADAEYQPPTT